jgi:hypothetical protein
MHTCSNLHQVTLLCWFALLLFTFCCTWLLKPVAAPALSTCRPQAERSFDDNTLAYIDSLDAERDEAILAAHGITLRPECLRVFRVCTMVLKKGAKAGLTPSQIAGVLCREGLTKSVVEKLHSNAMHLAKMQQGVSATASASSLKEREVDMAVYMRHMEQLLDEYLEEFLLEGSELMY